MLGVWRDENTVMTEDVSLFDEVQPAPTGTVTFLFTDIEGSTRLLQQLGRRYGELQAAHQGAIRGACRAWGGYEVDTQGDSFLWAFQAANDAVQAAITAQKKIDDLRLMTDDSTSNHQSSVINPPSSVVSPPSSVTLRVRMSLHTGEPTLVNGRYIGLDLNRGARICAAAHGGQVLLSPTTRDLVEGNLPDGVTLRDMGEHRLKDLRRARRLYQLVIPGRDNDFPPLRSLTAHRNNLPIQATSLVDREAEFKALRTLLTRASVRLVTLTGPGGVGKTRLALHTAAEMFDLFPDGVFFVPLASVTDPELVLSAIAQALDLQEAGGKSLLESLRAWLKDKQMLLVLDNFEQVTHAGRLITQLLQAAPRVKALVTSRAVLRVYGEQEFGVHPLPVPTTDGRPRTADDATDYGLRTTDYGLRTTDYALRITHYPSVQLFVQRAQMVRHDFQVTPENASAVAAICARLDGLPLAIELAAARVKLLSPHAMLQRLDRRLTLLTSGSRDLPLRQQTLRASIDWSYDLLAEEERTVFRRLAVFVGGFTLDAAEEVVNATEDERPRTEAGAGFDDVLTHLETLVNESLVQQREDAAGDTRFTLLETIREYALERLDESGEADILRRRHAVYFLRYAEAAEPKLYGQEQGVWLKRLEEEHNNIRAALRWTRDVGEGAMAVKLGIAMSLFWMTRGYWSEGRAWLEQALRRFETMVPAKTRALALNSLAGLAFQQGDYNAAKTQYEKLLLVYNELEDKLGTAMTLGQLGLVEWTQGDYLSARTRLELSANMLREQGRKRQRCWVLSNLGQVTKDLGDFQQSQDVLLESLILATDVGDQWGTAKIQYCLGEVAYAQGDGEEAQIRFEQSYAIAHELGDTSSRAEALNGLGLVAMMRDDYARAQAYLNDSLSLRRELGDRSGMALALNGLAELGNKQRDLGKARQYWLRSLKLQQEVGDKRSMTASLEGLAETACLEGNVEQAVQLFTLSEGLRRRLGAARVPVQQKQFDQHTASLRGALGDSRFEALWQAGLDKTLDEVLALAAQGLAGQLGTL